MNDHGDISETLAPKSEQLDNIELASGPRVFTVDHVIVKPNTDQPVSVFFAEFQRPWKPSKNMRRVLGYCWGEKSVHWAGHRVELFRDPDVTYSKDKTGGTRIRALSDIPGPIDVPILVSQGRAGTYHVELLTELAQPTADQIAAITDTTELAAMWRAWPALRTCIEARVADLKAPASGALIPAAPVPGGTE